MNEYLEKKYSKEYRALKTNLKNQELFKKMLEDGFVCTVDEISGEEYSTMELYETLIMQAKILIKFFQNVKESIGDPNKAILSVDDLLEEMSKNDPD